VLYCGKIYDPDVAKFYLIDCATLIYIESLRSVRNTPFLEVRPLGDLLERGREFGVVTPLIQVSYANLRVYEARLSVK
jgi:hypothetical protein